MATTSSKGIPLPEGGDPFNVPADLGAVATWIDDHPGISAVTTTERDVLVGPAIWPGKVIFNLTTEQLEINETGVAGAPGWAPLYPSDGAAGTASLRTLGTGAQQAAAGNHTHPAAGIVSGTLDIARLPVAASGESSATKVVRADDSRLTPAAWEAVTTVNLEVDGGIVTPGNMVKRIRRCKLGPVWLWNGAIKIGTTTSHTGSGHVKLTGLVDLTAGEAADQVIHWSGQLYNPGSDIYSLHGQLIGDNALAALGLSNAQQNKIWWGVPATVSPFQREAADAADIFVANRILMFTAITPAA